MHTVNPLFMLTMTLVAETLRTTFCLIFLFYQKHLISGRLGENIRIAQPVQTRLVFSQRYLTYKCLTVGNKNRHCLKDLS